MCIRDRLELGEKVLKGLLDYERQRSSANGSPRRIVKAAATLYDFIDESIWLDMLKARNNRTQMYNATAARRFADEILQQYIPEFQRLEMCIRDRDIMSVAKLYVDLDTSLITDESVLEIANAVTADMQTTGYQTLEDLGTAAWNAGKKEEAMEYYKKSLEINPENPSATYPVSYTHLLRHYR